LSLAIDSSRFGLVEIDPDTVIEFPDGLIGLGGTRYALLAPEMPSPFLWLHSLDDPTFAMPIANPHQFFGAFAVEMTDEDAERCEFDDATPVDVYVTVRSAPELDDFTANCKAPILLRRGKGFQVINQAPDSELKARLFAEVTQTTAAAASA
jgi:flagellar assembly factor FliW